MDKKLEHLTFTSELKTTLLHSYTDDEKPRALVSYDADFDALIILLAPTKDTIVHYINDDHVALLYEADTKEIVGIQIEDFVYSFLPKHDSVDQIWRLSESDAKVENVGDLILAFERKTPQIAHEVFKATAELLGREGLELGGTLA